MDLGVLGFHSRNGRKHNMPRKKAPPKQPDVFRVSQSKVKTWRRCRQAYHLKYVEKLKAKRRPRALHFGTLVHKMIETHIEGDDPMDVLIEARESTEAGKLFAAEKAEYLETIEDARRIMVEYFIYWDQDPKPLRYERIKGRSAEHSFDIELLPDVVWNGKIDARGTREGLRWLVEHKSFNRRPNDDDRWRNLQSSSYFRAMDMLGWKPVDGTCWDYIWSKPPIIAGMLKDGKMSRKSIDTMPSTVVDSIRLHGLKDHDYRDLIKASEKNRQKWFMRIYTRVDEEARDFIFNEFVDTIKEMVEGHGKKKDMNIERHCSWCDFEPLCRAKLQGLDYEFIKERHYEKSESKNREDAVHVLTHKEIES